ncbi:MAG: hypothetical protein U9Q80_07090 [Bacillota bacterium]|nr:hypothetical protein [Bacillota bacterium]
MKLISELIQNYKNQIKKYYEIEQITKFVHENDGNAESIIEGLHRSQKIIDKINALDEQRIDIEKKCIEHYNMKRFDIVHLPDEINTDLQVELIETIEKLRDVIKIALEYKAKEKTIIRKDLAKAKGKIKETAKGVNAVHGYKNRSYDSVFIDKVSK